DPQCELHIDTDGSHILGAINLAIDPTTGALTVNLGSFNVASLNLSTSNCGLVSDIINGAVGLLDAFGLLNGIISSAITPQLQSLIDGFLPNPPGIAGTLATGRMFASYDAPQDATMEMLLVAGGYVSAFGGGLNLGVLTGINSDRDQTTRGPGQTSEPNLCVPARPAPDLGSGIWNLPANPVRPDHLLDPAPEFSGMPDPTDANGNVQDVAMGLSRSFLNLAGFHAYNSGTLCLAISGGLLAQLNAGALGVLIPSLGNLVENRKGPVAVVLRPEQPPVFSLGSGATGDPLINVQMTDLRVDFYAFIEERYVRIFTLALDMNIGVDLTIAPDANGMPAITPMISGIDKKSVQARVSNTDLLQENPKKLASSLLGLIDLATGQLMGAIKPFPLPSVQGFSLDGLQISRVQTQEDDFLAIYGTLAQNPNGMPFPLSPLMVNYQRTPHGVETTAQIADVSVPPPDVILAAAQAGQLVAGSVPSVTLRLGGNAPALEWSYRIDGGAWHPWSTDANPTIVDGALLLQAKHTMDVKARSQRDWITEDPTPEHLEFVIDSVPPELTLTPESDRIAFSAWDNVTDDNAIRFSWQTAAGWTTPGLRAFLTLDEAWAASAQGTRPLAVRAYDERDNVSEVTIDLNTVAEFHGRTTATGSAAACSCHVGAGPHSHPGDVGVWMLAFLAMVGLMLRRNTTLLRRNIAVAARFLRRRSSTALVALIALGALSLASGCGASARSGCLVDDDCRASEMCGAGELAACVRGACACQADLPLGD
ncbi:MAG TPA: hypothetical protein VE987_21885, partial [Polyangiaceae bacterium]|nr:hypothetical protein [Polyangiaceae bacterium]